MLHLRNVRKLVTPSKASTVPAKQSLLLFSLYDKVYYFLCLQMGGWLMFLRDVIVSAKNNGSKRGDSGWVANNWKVFSDSWLLLAQVGTRLETYPKLLMDFLF